MNVGLSSVASSRFISQCKKQNKSSRVVGYEPSAATSPGNEGVIFLMAVSFITNIVSFITDASKIRLAALWIRLEESHKYLSMTASVRRRRCGIHQQAAWDLFQARDAGSGGHHCKGGYLFFSCPHGQRPAQWPLSAAGYLMGLCVCFRVGHFQYEDASGSPRENDALCPGNPWDREHLRGDLRVSEVAWVLSVD